MSAADSEGDAERQRFAALLDHAASQPRTIAFWWRDDDAEAPTPALERLLALARRHDLPLALAVIPKGATQALAERLANEPRVFALQHGWQHRNHAPAHEKKAELGDHRPRPEVMAELANGSERLSALFGEKFLPVLVPPWNRIAAAVRDARSEVGLIGFSAFDRAPSDAAHWVNTHVDVIDWRARSALPRATAYALLCREVERRLADEDAEPLGILTHHLVHQEETWAFLEELFALIGEHAAIAWPPVPELFGLER